MNDSPDNDSKSRMQRVLAFLERFRDVPAAAWGISTGAVTLFAGYFTLVNPGWTRAASLAALIAVVVSSVLASAAYTLLRPSLSERILRAKRDYDMGCIAFEDKRYPLAMDLFSRASQEVEEYRYVSKFGRVSLRLGHYDKAIPALTKCYELAPTKTERLAARRNRGVAFLITGQLGSAVADFNEYLESKKKSPVILRHRALAYFIQGDLVKAEHDARDAARIGSTNSAPYATLAIILDRRGDSAGALRNLDKALKDPETPAAYYALAQACAALGRLDDAYHYLSRTVQADSRFSPRAKLDPLLDALRADGARFDKAVEVVEWKFLGPLEEDS